MNLFARILLVFALLTGAGTAVVPRPEAPACACCDEPMGQCPCGPTTPAPLSHRVPCAAPPNVLSVATESVGQEAAPEAAREAKPLDGLRQVLATAASAAEGGRIRRGREPDLGRHLAQLGTFRI